MTFIVCICQDSQVESKCEGMVFDTYRNWYATHYSQSFSSLMYCNVASKLTQFQLRNFLTSLVSSIILWMHTDGATKLLKCASVSSQLV